MNEKPNSSDAISHTARLLQSMSGLQVLRSFYGPLIFADVDLFIKCLQGFIDQQQVLVRQVMIYAGAMPSIDLTAVESLRPFLQKLIDQGTEVVVARAPVPLRELKLAIGISFTGYTDSDPGGVFMEKKIKCNNGKQAFPERSSNGSFRNIALVFVLVITTFVVVGCATDQMVQLPPVASNPSGEVYAGKFVWIDLLTEDTSAAAVFYRDLFGWQAKISKENKDYYVFLKGEKSIGGMVAAENRDKQASESLWLLSLSVDDVDRAAALVKKRGGKLLEDPLDAKGRGRMALISDPAGAPLILLRAAGGDPVDTKAGTGEWLWTDLFTQNANNAGDFYSALAGYQAERIEVKKDHQYDVLKRDGRLRAGIVELRWDDLEDNWLPYFKVADVSQTIERARQLGGRLIIEAEDVAVLSDPTGAVFGIQMMR